MDKELIIVKQLPIIEEQLLSIKEKFQDEADYALSLECNENSYKIVKEGRANFTKLFNDLEERRKTVKKEILTPYEKFDSIYKDCVTTIYETTKTKLDKKVSEIENGLKEQKRKVIIDYFEEYAQAVNIDFISFEQLKINITLGASLKSLKEQVKSFLDKASDDLKMIDTQTHKEEILVEYKKSLNVSAVILQVNERHKAIEEEKARIAKIQEEKEKQRQATEKVEEVVIEEMQNNSFSAPAVKAVEDKPTEKIYAVTFKVRSTFEKLRELKAFLVNGGYEYEQ